MCILTPGKKKIKKSKHVLPVLEDSVLDDRKGEEVVTAKSMQKKFSVIVNVRSKFTDHLPISFDYLPITLNYLPIFPDYLAISPEYLPISKDCLPIIFLWI